MKRSKIFLTFLTVLAALSAHSAMAARHSVVVCQTEPGYTQMMNQVIALVSSGHDTKAKILTIINANNCTRDVWHPGQPKYNIVDSDGSFVIISNGTNTGYMTRHDYDQMYVVGLGN